MVISHANLPKRHVWPYLLGVAVLAVFMHWGRSQSVPDALGLSADVPVVALLAMVALRGACVRLFVMHGGRQRLEKFPAALQQALLKWRTPFIDRTSVAVSVGGTAIPLGLAFYELFRAPPNLALLWIAVMSIVGAILILHREALRRAMRIPLAVAAPALAALLGWLLVGADQRSAFAGISGFIGILTATDLVSLHDFKNLGRPEVIVGGGESFDAIFVNQLCALFFC